MQMRYAVLVSERLPISAAAVPDNAPTPVLRDVWVTVETDVPAAVNDMARLAAMRVWSDSHSGDVPEHFDLQILESSPAA